MPAIAQVRFASVVGGRNSGLNEVLSGEKNPMLPTPGSKSVRFEMTMKIKNVVANGKTQRVTRLSKISPIRLSHISTSDSKKFWIPLVIYLMFFEVVARKMIKINAATIHVQIIELVTGKPRT